MSNRRFCKDCGFHIVRAVFRCPDHVGRHIVGIAQEAYEDPQFNPYVPCPTCGAEMQWVGKYTQEEYHRTHR